MDDSFEESTSKGFDLPKILGIVHRRHLLFLIPLFIGWVVVWSASWVLPPRYKSTTTILVEQPTMPQNYVVPNISDDLQTRLQSITTQILSRTRLLYIIQKFHLYGGVPNGSSGEAAVDRMRKDIDVELVRDPQKQDISAFRVSYLASSPRVAQEITGELTDLFINENLKTRQEESQQTTDFIAKQLDDARQSLAQQDAKVQQFESAHAGTLPGQQASNMAILTGLQQQLQNEEDALNTAKQQHVYYQAMLEEERANPVKVRTPGTESSGASGAVDLATIDQNLEKMKAQLADLSSRYTDKYPDIVSLKSQIARAETTRNSLAASLKQRSAAAAATGAEDPTLSQAGQQVKSELQANQLEIKNRESAIAGLNAKIADYQGRLNSTPLTQQALDDLNRGYDQSKANYDDLLKKKNESEMATSMETTQQGERFTMLDPPSLPTKPDSPNRLKFCGLGLGVGLALGLLVAGGFEFFDDRLHSESEIKALLKTPIISEVPEVFGLQDQEKTKRRMVLGWVTASFVLVTILAGSLISYLRS